MLQPDGRTRSTRKREGMVAVGLSALLRKS